MNTYAPLVAGQFRQPYAHYKSVPGEPTRDPITLVSYKIGQPGPRTEESWKMAHGRYLAGLGGLNETQQPWDDVKYQGSALRQLEKEDDAYGSGIFDTYGRSPTVHPDMGVFADHPSLPGYIDREVQYTVSRDIYDITSGAEVVVVPGGGMTYQERGGLPVPFDRTGMAPCPPGRSLAPPTDLSQVYVTLDQYRPRPPRPYMGPSRMKLLGPGGRSGPMPTQHPGFVVPRALAKSVPSTEMPMSVVSDVLLPPGMMSQVPKGGIVNTGVTSYPTGQQYNPMQVPYNNNPMLVPNRQIVTTGSPSTSVSGYGAADDKPGWGTYAFAGLLVGSAAAFLFGATRIKVKR